MTQFSEVLGYGAAAVGYNFKYKAIRGHSVPERIVKRSQLP